MRRATILILVILAGAAIVLADAPRVGVVTGTVKGPDGQAMPGATVQLVSARGTETAISDADGAFKFAFIIPDTYTLRADLAGFQAAEGDIVVTAGGRADVELRLTEVAGEEIVVTGEAPLVNKFDVSTGGTMDAKEIANIVAPARYYNTMLNFFPEVTDSQEGGAGAPDIAGNTTWRTTFYVDGVDTSFGRFGGTTQIRLPSVAVGQIQLYTSRADAEFSRSMGGISTVTIKSGTNKFHGDVSATFQNQAWNETYRAFPTSDPPDEIDVRWEAAIGGPIARDKVWFFVAAADQGASGYAVLPNGEQVSTSSTLEPKVGKLDWRPSSQHALSLIGSETPITFPYWGPSYADRYSAAAFEQGGEFYSLRWNWAISEDWFLDTALASQKTFDTRDWLFQHPADPSAPVWSPLANPTVVYQDQGTGLCYNAVCLPLGPGSIDYPRDQANVAINRFLGDHDIKLGLDYQDTSWTVMSKALDTVFGVGYNPNRVAGFTTPRWIRYYVGPADVGGVTSGSKTWAMFVRDRFTAGDRWTFNLGLRVDDQKHSNDAGTVIFQHTDLAPRLTAAYDVWADSRLLITAGAGRYYDWIPMGLTEDFNQVAQGRKEYDQYAWNAATQDFDIFQRHVSGASDIAVNTITPAYKDEYTLGAEWAFHANWAVKANILYYKQQNQYSQEEQVLTPDPLTIGYVYENNPYAKQERSSLTLQLRRRFRDNWTMNASYVYSDTSGNCYNVNNIFCYHGLGRLVYFTNPETGVPWTLENRDGDLWNSLRHVVKVRGAYLLPIGRNHTLNFGGIAQYRSGRRWNMGEVVTVTPGETVVHYTEPMGVRTLGDVFQVDLNASWRFPIVKSVQGSLLVEVVNVTNNQEQTNFGDTAMLTGDPTRGLTTAMIQNPRSVRALATLSF